MAKEDLKNKDWESILDEDAYQVTRCFATEAPYSGKFLDNKREGTYICICCKKEFFLLPQNIIQVVDGQVFFSQLMKHASQNIKIHPME